METILVAYFSATGVTARVALRIAEVTNGQSFPIKPAKPYTAEDLNWHDKKSRTSLEMADSASRPAIADKIPDMDKFQVVFLGFPIWWYQAPRIVETFLGEYDFTGKTIVPFATSGSSPLGDTEAILEKLCPGANWLPGRRLSATVSTETLRDWVKELGIKDE